MPWADNPNVSAILAAHFPGQESGNSIVDVLYGDVNPSGRLPYTIAMNASDYNTQIVNITTTNDTDPNAWQDDFSEGLLIDYRHFDQANITPRYEFGYGLSYTTFDFAWFLVSATTNISQYAAAAAIQPGGNPNLFQVVMIATVAVTNIGTGSGAAVPQLYVSLPQGSVPSGTPVKVLRGFEKVTLEPGSSQVVTFDLTRKDLSYWDTKAQDWAVPSGNITIMVGSSSRNLPLSETIMLR